MLSLKRSVLVVVFISAFLTFSISRVLSNATIRMTKNERGDEIKAMAKMYVSILIYSHVLIHAAQ